jgi:hypothetical protein
MVYWLVGHIGGLTCWSARCLRLVDGRSVCNAGMCLRDLWFGTR